MLILIFFSRATSVRGWCARRKTYNILYVSGSRRTNGRPTYRRRSLSAPIAQRTRYVYTIKYVCMLSYNINMYVSRSLVYVLVAR